MPTNRDLLFSILAMVSYNRGYAEGLKNVGTAIGSATVQPLPDSVDIQAWQAAGFYAAAYRLDDGSSVISYRGTDKYSGDESVGGDIWNGWTLGAGFDLQAAE